MPISLNLIGLIAGLSGAVTTDFLFKKGVSIDIASQAGSTVTGVVNSFSFKQKQINASSQLKILLQKKVKDELEGFDLPEEARNAVLAIFADTDVAGLLLNNDAAGRLGLQMREFLSQCEEFDIETMPFETYKLVLGIVKSLEDSVIYNHELTTLISYFKIDVIQRDIEKILESFAILNTVGKTVQGKQGRWLLSYNKNFVGRELKLEEIEKKFSKSFAVSITQTIHGLGGVGKSQLALRYAYKFAAENPQSAVWWFAAEDEDVLEKDVLRFLLSIGVNPNPSINESVSQALHRWAASNNECWLLVFDNVETYDKVEKYIPTGPIYGRILLTTRNRKHFPELVNLAEYTDEEAKEYLRNILKSKYDEKAAYALMKRFGNFPLALTQAAAKIIYRNWDISQYLEKIIRYGPEKMPPVETEADYKKYIWETWSLTFDELTDEAKDAKRLLNILSYFSADNLPVKEFDASPFNHLFSDEEAFDDAVQKLRDYAMIDENDRIHRLLQEVVRHEDKDKSAHAEAMACLVDALYKAYEREKDEQLENIGESVFAKLAPHLVSACSYVISGVTWTLKFEELREQKKLSSDDERFKWQLLFISAQLEKILDVQRRAYNKLMGKKMLLNKDGTVWLFGGFEWEVLQERTYKGKRQALIITRKVVELRAYDQITREEWLSEAYKGTSWEKCSLRAYLNNLSTSRDYYIIDSEEPYATKKVIPAGDFVKNGFLRYFTAEERKRIYKPKPPTDEPIANPNTEYVTLNGTNIVTPGGAPTWDAVFLLSLADIDTANLPSWETNPDWFPEYDKSWDEWLQKKTPYNLDLIAADDKDTSWWWLRSPGYYAEYAAVVSIGGSVHIRGDYVYSGAGGVRPALWLNL